jgi:hypothetical protein
VVGKLPTTTALLQDRRGILVRWPCLYIKAPSYGIEDIAFISVQCKLRDVDRQFQELVSSRVIVELGCSARNLVRRRRNEVRGGKYMARLAESAQVILDWDIHNEGGVRPGHVERRQ